MREAEVDPGRSAEEECGKRSSTRGGVRKKESGAGLARAEDFYRVGAGGAQRGDNTHAECDGEHDRLRRQE